MSMYHSRDYEITRIEDELRIIASSRSGQDRSDLGGRRRARRRR